MDGVQNPMKDVIQKAARIADSGLRMAGLVGNAGLLLALTYALFWLKGQVITAYGEIGPLPQLTATGVATWMQDPALASRSLAVAKLWGCSVAMVGTGWMTLLGFRWAYHAVLAIVHRLKWL
jgi:hypothetical protein